jgi:hypothetical protein
MVIGADEALSDKELPVAGPGSVNEPIQPGPTREPIDSAPQDGRDVMVYYGPGDETGRVARWHAGRRFNGRRWVTGGHWVPSDSPAPLPADEPTEWLRFPDQSQSDEPEPAAA